MASEIEQLGSNPMPPPPPTQPPAPGPARPQRDFWQIMRLIGSIGGLTAGAILLMISPLFLIGWGECALEAASAECESSRNRAFLGIVAVAALPLLAALLSFVKDPRKRKWCSPIYVVGGLVLLAPLLLFPTIGMVTIAPGVGLLAHVSGDSGTSSTRPNSTSAPTQLYRASAASFVFLLFVIGAGLAGLPGRFLPSIPMVFLLWVALAVAGFVTQQVQSAEA